MDFKTLFKCENLKGKTGDASVSSLAGKYVLLYFSAHWCPPCRGFTPALATFYNNLRTKRSDFEIVFVSSDRSEAEFEEYYNEHPWLALPYSERDTKAELSSAMEVRGIPTLVVLDSHGSVITKRGREGVSQDPEGDEFPWKPQTFFEILGDAPFKTHTGKSLTGRDLKSMDAFALYFSAHWCPPCRAFTPQLAEVYKSLKAARGDRVEIIYCSGDNTEEEFNEYYETMPWAAIPFNDKRRGKLDAHFEVEGIPTLVTVGPDGTIINKKARGVASKDKDGSLFPWAPQPRPAVLPLERDDDAVEALNELSCVVLYLLNTPESAESHAEQEVFKNAAAEVVAQRPGKLQFFYTAHHTPVKPLTEEEAKRCPEGHELKEYHSARWRCDVCLDYASTGPEDVSMGCKEGDCDYDVCAACYTSKRRPLSQQDAFVQRVIRASEVVLPSSEDPVVIAFKLGSKRAILESTSLPTQAEITEFALNFIS